MSVLSALSPEENVGSRRNGRYLQNVSFHVSLRDCGVTFVSGGGGDGGGVTSEKTVKAVDGISTSVSVKSLDVFVTSEGCHHRIHLGRPWEDVQQRL